MVSSRRSHREEPFEVEIHRTVRRFLNRHPDLDSKWEEIVEQVKNNPRLGQHIDHLKGDWHCSFRWDEGTYRIKYQVMDDQGAIHFYDANTRGDVYKKSKGTRRRR